MDCLIPQCTEEIDVFLLKHKSILSQVEHRIPGQIIDIDEDEYPLKGFCSFHYEMIQNLKFPDDSNRWPNAGQPYGAEL